MINQQTKTQVEAKEYLICRKRAAEFLGIKENTLAVWAVNKRYELPFYKVGRLVKYKISDLEIFIEKNKHENICHD